MTENQFFSASLSPSSIEIDELTKNFFNTSTRSLLSQHPLISCAFRRFGFVVLDLFTPQESFQRYSPLLWPCISLSTCCLRSSIDLFLSPIWSSCRLYISRSSFWWLISTCFVNSLCLSVSAASSRSKFSESM